MASHKRTDLWSVRYYNSSLNRNARLNQKYGNGKGIDDGWIEVFVFGARIARKWQTNLKSVGISCEIEIATTKSTNQYSRKNREEKKGYRDSQW